MKLRALITIPRNGRTVHPGESFRVEADEAPALIDAGKAEPLVPPAPKPRLSKAPIVRKIAKAN